MRLRRRLASRCEKRSTLTPPAGPGRFTPTPPPQVIYGKDFDASAQRILEANRWERFQQEVLIVTARGIGKTWSVAMFVAALLMHCPAISISVFAVAKRAAVNMIRLIDQMASSHPTGRGMVVTPRSAERLRMRAPGAGAADERVVTALPSRSDTTRGVHSNVVIVDEMAFITDALLKETILPTIVKKRTCMVGISTPQGRDNIYTWLTTFVEPNTDPPRLMFNVVQAGRVCPACLAADKALECTHMRASVPPWMSLGKVARMQQLFADDPHLHARENLGVVADAGRKAFPAADVEALCANVARDVAPVVKCVYVACDPSGGGSSEFALVGVAEEVSGRLSVRPPPSPLPPSQSARRSIVPAIYFTPRRRRVTRTPSRSRRGRPRGSRTRRAPGGCRGPRAGRPSRAPRPPPSWAKAARPRSPRARPAPWGT